MPQNDRQIRGFVFGLLAFALMGVGGCTSVTAPSNDSRTDSRTRVQAPALISVEGWGGTRSGPSSVAPQKLTHITLHHGGVSFTREQSAPQYLRNLQGWSRNTRKWSDIPYHYLIDLDGNIYEARDINLPGDTNTNYDPTGHALIMVMGNYEEVQPNPAQLAAVSDLMAMLAATYQIPTSKIGGHRDYTNQTVCPGKNLLPYLVDGTFRREVEARLARR